MEQIYQKGIEEEVIDMTYEEWHPLIAIDDLKGLRGLRGFTGITGAPGKTPEIRVFEGFLQSTPPLQ